MAVRAVTALVLLLSAVAMPLGVGWTGAPAAAAARVTVANGDGDAVADPTYATTVTVRGRGFQSIRGGHGGVYVFFGTVKGTWRPSQGGQTGRDYFYVPDSEARSNQGFQRYVAFPGSDTASSANGGVMKDDGSFSTSLVIPGAVFQAADRSGRATTIDCRTVRCGIITVGAHGVVNARNETFTPVTFRDLQSAGSDEPAGATSTAQPSTPSASEAPAAGEKPAKRAPRAPAALEVDRASARAGHVLPFTATGLPVGTQVSAVLDDGVAGAGPFVVGQHGQLAGVLTLPADLAGGTHELRLFGTEDAPTVRFAVTPAAATDVEPVAAEDRAWVGPVFAAASAALLLGVLARLLLQRRGVRRRA